MVSVAETPTNGNGAATVVAGDKLTLCDMLIVYLLEDTVFTLFSNATSRIFPALFTTEKQGCFDSSFQRGCIRS